MLRYCAYQVKGLMMTDYKSISSLGGMNVPKNKMDILNKLEKSDHLMTSLHFSIQKIFHLYCQRSKLFQLIKQSHYPNFNLAEHAMWMISLYGFNWDFLGKTL